MRYVTESIAQSLYENRINEAHQSLKGGIPAYKVKKGMKLVGNRKYIENPDENDIYTVLNVVDLGKDEFSIETYCPSKGNIKKVFYDDDIVGFPIKEDTDFEGDTIEEAVDIHSINIKSVKPEKKDLDRAVGIKSVSDASKMAKLIKDPMKLIRRTKAVYAVHYSDKSSNKEDYWSPFIQAMKDMGFTDGEISDLMVSYDKFVPKDINTDKAKITKKDTTKEKNTNIEKSINAFNGSTSSVPFEGKIDEISKGELIALNKKKYDFVVNNVDKLVKDKINKEISKTLVLRWIKGRNWEGGLGNGKDVDKMCDNICDKLNLDFDDLGERFDDLCMFWEKEFEKNNK